MPVRATQPRVTRADRLFQRVEAATQTATATPIAEDLMLSGAGGSVARGFFATTFAPFIFAQRAFVHSRVDAEAQALGFTPTEARRCADDAFAHLDVSMSSFMVFRDDFRALDGDPRVERFLVDLQRAAASARRQSDARVDVYGLAKRHAGSDAEAVRWLAVLFQDRKPFFMITVGETTLARQVTATLALLEHRDVNPKLNWYPPSVASMRGGAYHFFVPALLARKLADAGHSPRLSASVATFFNAEYEIQQAALAEVKGKPTWWSRTIAGARHLAVGSAPSLNNAEDVDDVNLGVAGARFALGVDVRAGAVQPGADVVAQLVAGLNLIER